MNKTIEALKEIADYLRDCANSPAMAAKVDAIREALADHIAEADKMVAEPVRRPQNCGTGYCSCIECPYEPVKPSQLADASLEPVYFVHFTGDFWVETTKGKYDATRWNLRKKLYAAPVQREWVDLTCEEVTALIREGASGGGWQGFATRVQDAFKEKNK